MQLNVSVSVVTVTGKALLTGRCCYDVWSNFCTKMESKWTIL